MQLPRTGLMLQTRFLFSSGHPQGNCVFEIQTIFGQKEFLIIFGGEGQWEEGAEKWLSDISICRVDFATSGSCGLGGCLRMWASWCGLEMPDPWKKAVRRRKNVRGVRNAFGESVWPQTDIAGNKEWSVGPESPVFCTNPVQGGDCSSSQLSGRGLWSQQSLPSLAANSLYNSLTLIQCLTGFIQKKFVENQQYLVLSEVCRGLLRWIGCETYWNLVFPGGPEQPPCTVYKSIRLRGESISQMILFICYF